MTSTTQTATADALAPVAKLTVFYADKLAADIPPERFARTPEGMKTNHPAWAFGHLAVYPDHILELIGRGDLAKPEARYTELFEHDTECRDDPDGTIYPGKDEIVGRFMERMNTAIGALEGADDAALARPNTLFLAEMLPTAGALANFMLGSHAMMHLGQVSAWRRAMGLGPCM